MDMNRDYKLQKMKMLVMIFYLFYSFQGEVLILDKGIQQQPIVRRGSLQRFLAAINKQQATIVPTIKHNGQQASRVNKSTECIRYSRDM